MKIQQLNLKNEIINTFNNIYMMRPNLLTKHMHIEKYR